MNAIETKPKTWVPALPEFADTISPSRPADVAEALATFNNELRSVVPVGGGGALALGNLTDPSAIALRLDGLNRVRSYEPTDMTLSVDAGVTLSQIRQTLGERGQMIPIEAPDPEHATIGSLLATALTGPRRYGGGTLRDVVIGIEVAYPDGTLGKAGGLVVKNVSGFDMMRVHYGALGTLGVITGANFKVLASPREEITYLRDAADLAEAEQIAAQLRPLPNRPVALVVHQESATVTIAARFEGRTSGLRAVADRIAPLFASGSPMSGIDSVAYWQSIIDARRFDGASPFRLQVGTKPSESFALVRLLQSESARLGLSGSVVEIEPGIGQINVTFGALEESSIEPARFLIAKVRESANVRVVDGPVSLRLAIDVWGSEPETIDLMRRLKQEYDPNAILNPVRFAGYL